MKQTATKRHARTLGSPGEFGWWEFDTATFDPSLSKEAHSSHEQAGVSSLWVTGEICAPDVDGGGSFHPGVASGSLTMLRGTSAGLEFVFAGEAFDEAWAEMDARLAERPDFYRGSQATAIFDSDAPDEGAIATFLAAVGAYGIDLRGIFGPAEFEGLAERHSLSYLGEPQRPTVANFQRKREARSERVVELTERARSLDADFAGARADIANRRARGESSVPRPVFAPPPAAAAAQTSVTQLPATLYHRGTLRGGQALQQLGSIVVVGDVNPGAELVATGDIIVFGALRGTAHAGAQGDANARVYALELAPTQLRIATLIATDDGGRRAREPEVAYIAEDRIAIAPHAQGV